jgi:hypothetical protein
VWQRVQLCASKTLRPAAWGPDRAGSSEGGDISAVPPGGKDWFAELAERFLQPTSSSAAVSETPMRSEASVPLGTKYMMTPEKKTKTTIVFV